MTYLDYLIHEKGFKCTINAKKGDVKIRINDDSNKLILNKTFNSLYDVNFAAIDNELTTILKTPLSILISELVKLNSNYRIKIRKNYIMICEKSFKSPSWIKLSTVSKRFICKGKLNSEINQLINNYLIS